MKSHLVVVFLLGLQDAESALKTTNGTDIIIEKEEKGQKEKPRAQRCDLGDYKFVLTLL